MTTRMTAQRMSQLISDGDAEGVRTAVRAQPRLLAATIERRGEAGWTPLHLAVAAGHRALVEDLAAAGADLSARTEGGRTPLHVALQHAPDLAPLVRDLGGPVDAVSAAHLGDVPRLTAALDAGATMTDPTLGVELLSLAAPGGSIAAVDLLLARGADPDRGALSAAAEAGRPEVVARLLEAGARVDRRDPDTGRTALHAAVAAASEGAADVVRLLLAAGADIDATTNDGASALDICRVAAAQHLAVAAQGPAHAAGAVSTSEELADLLVSAGAAG